MRRAPSAALPAPATGERHDWQTLLLAAYGALRFSTVLFTELREIFFARVTQRAVRTITLQVFEHLHALSCASTSIARPAA
jgi:hypothetical protein